MEAAGGPTTAQQHALLRAAFSGDTETLRRLLGEVNTAVLQAFTQIGGSHVNELANRVTAMDLDAIMMTPTEGMCIRWQPNKEMHMPGKMSMTLMAAAIEAGHTSVVAMLLKARASPDSPPGDHEHHLMPLRGCVSSKAKAAKDCMLLLLQAGAAVDQQIASGATCLSLLCQGTAPWQSAIHNSTDSEAIRLLIMHGASLDLAKRSGATPLFCAAQSGCSDAVRLLIYAAADVTKRFQSGATALMISAGNGHAAAVEMLLCARASIDAVASGGTTALSLAHEAAADSSTGTLSAMMELNRVIATLEHEAESGQSSTGSQARLRVGDLTTLVGLKSRPDLHRVPARIISAYDEERRRYGVQTLSVAALLGSAELGAAMGGDEKLRVKAENVLERGQGLLPPGPGDARLPPITGSELVSAMANGGGEQMHAFRHLLASRPELARESPIYLVGDQVQRSEMLMVALHLQCGAPAAVRAILTHAADLVDKVLQMGGDGGGLTPLQIASHLGSVELAEALLDCGATIDLGGHQTPLLTAIGADQMDCVQLLLRRHADVNRVDADGYSPLLAACEWGVPRAVELLLEHRADPATENASAGGAGYCALVAAANSRHPDCCRHLVSARADPSQTRWTPLTVFGFEEGRSYTALDAVDHRIARNREHQRVAGEGTTVVDPLWQGSDQIDRVQDTSNELARLMELRAVLRASLVEEEVSTQDQVRQLAISTA